MRRKTMMFTAAWCGPCKAVKRMLEKNPALAEKIRMVDIDTAAGEAEAAEHKVRALPTFITPDGRRQLGGMGKRELVAFLGEP